MRDVWVHSSAFKFTKYKFWMNCKIEHEFAQIFVEISIRHPRAMFSFFLKKTHRANSSVVQIFSTQMMPSKTLRSTAT